MSQLVSMSQTFLPDVGKALAIDGKIIESYANQCSTLPADGRRETEATFTAKSHYSKVKVVKTVYYFGRVHLLADVNYEFPIALKVTPANDDEKRIAQEWLLQQTSIIKESQYLMADKGYDGKAFREFVESKGMATIIPPRHMWGSPESRQYQNTPLYYDQDGRVWYCNEEHTLIE